MTNFTASPKEKKGKRPQGGGGGNRNMPRSASAAPKAEKSPENKPKKSFWKKSGTGRG